MSKREAKLQWDISPFEKKERALKCEYIGKLGPKFELLVYPYADGSIDSELDVISPNGQRNQGTHKPFTPWTEHKGNALATVQELANNVFACVDQEYQSLAMLAIQDGDREKAKALRRESLNTYQEILSDLTKALVKTPGSKWNGWGNKKTASVPASQLLRAVTNWFKQTCASEEHYNQYFAESYPTYDAWIQAEGQMRYTLQDVGIKDDMVRFWVPSIHSLDESELDDLKALITRSGWNVKLLNDRRGAILEKDRPEALRVEVPSKLYHMTLSCNASKILRQGIVPKSRETDRHNYRDRVHLFLTYDEPLITRMAAAIYYEDDECSAWGGDISGLEVTVLEVDTTKFQASYYKDTDAPNSVWTKTPIPPEALSVYSEHVDGDWSTGRVAAMPAMSMPPAVYQKPAYMTPNHWYQFINGKSLEKAFGLAPKILLHMIEKESKGDPMAKSNKGAKGLFQIMPPSISGFTGNPYDPIQSAKFVAETLKSYLDHFDGSYEKALAAYNWGRGNVARKGLDNLPAETENYLDYFKRKGVI